MARKKQEIVAVEQASVPAVVPNSYASVVAKATEAGFGNTFRTSGELDDFTYVPTYVLIVDLVLMGGICEAQQHEFIGAFSAGKSTNSLLVAAAYQAAYPDMNVLYIDKEKTLDVHWAAALGVDLDRLLISQPDTGEQGMNTLDQILIEAFDVGLVIVDSIPSHLPQVAMAKSAEEHWIGLHAKLIGNAATKAAARLVTARNQGEWVVPEGGTEPEWRCRKPTVLWLNQWRSKITQYGASKLRSGGLAYPFYLFSSLELFNEEELKDDAAKLKIVKSNAYKFEALKNKSGNSMKTGMFRIVRDPEDARGIGFIDQGETVMTFAKMYGLVVSAGSKGFRLVPWDMVGKQGELIPWLEARPGCYRWLMREIVSRHRERFGKKRDGWYAGAVMDLEEPLALQSLQAAE